MIIPHERLSDEALRGLIEEFVTRDGTDYGAVEAALEGKVAEVRAQLDRGQAVILYDDADQTFTIVFKEDLPGTPD
jgi:uncharacterized protein YheU (UPF0270 family)